MTESATASQQHNTPSPAPNSPNYSPTLEVESFKRNQQSDWYLSQIVALFNNLNISVGLSLMVDGFLVTGKLATPEEYFTAMGNQLEDALVRGGGNPSDRGFFANVMRQFADASSPVEREVRAAAMEASLAAGVLPLQGGDRAYIHLKDASIYVPATGVRRLAQSFWRGRISAVGGFILGEPL